ncbi:MAG: glycosyltransferase [Lentisphaeria bacterium]|nr:glycosyltransferase [Lentisphaeria bacterium]
MMEKNRITVILAAYRGEKYIGEQLQSLFTQTRVPDEILIGDDSDTDATFQAVEAVKDRFPGEFHYIRNPQRLGFMRNFLHLAERSKGDLIFFCDQDDVWLPEKIETLTAILENDPPAQVAVCNSEMVDAELHPLHETMLSGIPDLQDRMAEINAGSGFEPILKRTIPFAGHNLAMKRSFLPVFRQIPDSYRYHDLWILQCAAVSGVLRYVDKVLTLYRLHGQNASAPCVQKVKKNFLHRFNEIRKSSGDIFSIARQMNDFADFMERNCPENPNRELLSAYCRYFNWRAELLAMPYFRRWLTICFHPWRLRDHYRYGFGSRSLVRDLIVKADKPGRELPR